MLSPLVFVLSLLGFGLLVLGERMGLPVRFGMGGIALVLVTALVSLGLFSVTSRLPRFWRGVDEEGTIAATTLAGRVATLLLMLLALPVGEGGMVLWLAFAAGYLLAQGVAGTGGNRARLVLLLPGMASLLLALALFAPVLEALSQASGLRQGVLRPALALLLALALLPGGALGLARLQRVTLASAMVLVGLPLLGLVALVLSDRVDSLAAETLIRLGQLALEAPPVPSWNGLSVACGLTAGYCARGSAHAKATGAVLGLAVGLMVAGGLALAHLGAEDWFSRLIGQRILGVAPGQWPLFAFEEVLQGWLRACGVTPVDPVDVVRACGSGSAGRVLANDRLAFLSSLSGPVLARANGLPVLVGYLWALLPVLLALAGYLALLLESALSFSQGLLHGVFNPTGLRSWRLAMARLSLLVLIGGLFALDRAGVRPLLATFTPVMGMLLGMSLLLHGIALARIGSGPQAQPT